MTLTLGEGSLVAAENRLTQGDIDEKQETNTNGPVVTTLVTSDGTYATQSAFNSVQ